jgi:hypothetical protein
MGRRSDAAPVPFPVDQGQSVALPSPIDRRWSASNRQSQDAKLKELVELVNHPEGVRRRRIKVAGSEELWPHTRNAQPENRCIYPMNFHRAAGGSR